MVVKLPGGTGEVHGRQGTAQHGGVGHQLGLLGGLGGGAVFDGHHGVHQELGAHIGQTVVEGLHGLIGVDGGHGLGDDVTGIQLQDHVHDGDAALGIAVEDGPVDGGRATVLGQQRGMDVDAAQLGVVQDLLGEDPAIGGHHDEVGGQTLDGLQGGAVPQLGGLEDRDVVLQGNHLHRGGQELHAPVLGLVRLGEDAHDLVAGFDESLEGGHRKVRGAHEQDLHQSSSTSRSPRSSMASMSASVMRTSHSSLYIWPSRWSVSWQKQRAVMPSRSYSTGLP